MLQMILLWKDPDGKTVTTASNHQTPLPSTMNKDMKIASLERHIGEKDNMIAQLNQEINLLKGVSTYKNYSQYNFYNHYTLLQGELEKSTKNINHL